MCESCNRLKPTTPVIYGPAELEFAILEPLLNTRCVCLGYTLRRLQDKAAPHGCLAVMPVGNGHRQYCDLTEGILLEIAIRLANEGKLRLAGRIVAQV